ncbi:MAG: hypothetical protein JW725_01020 [Candidatus Babeliaceae bacterium]|nr:hypothetical protein [Candidatus Babeliaceae bacterium]
MRPCDCKDQYTVDKKLDVSGIGFNGDSITVRPSVVILHIGQCELKIPQSLFKRFAEWYLEDQTPNQSVHLTASRR